MKNCENWLPFSLFVLHVTDCSVFEPLSGQKMLLISFSVANKPKQLNRSRTYDMITVLTSRAIDDFLTMTA